MKTLVPAALVPLALVGTASANFTGLTVDEYFSGDKYVADLYITFNNPADTVLNLYNIDASLEGGFGQLVHSDLVGPSWAPQFVIGGMETMDSFVTIGGAPGFFNTTQADPNWGPSGFNQEGIPALAGWFNGNPPNLQGLSSGITAKRLFTSETYTGLATMVMRMVFDSSLTSAPELSFAGSVTWNQGLLAGGLPGGPVQTDFDYSVQLFAGIPAPGALALLGLGALLGRSRRRT